MYHFVNLLKFTSSIAVVQDHMLNLIHGLANIVAVPLFFLISGFFTARKILEKNISYEDYFIDIISKIFLLSFIANLSAILLDRGSLQDNIFDLFLMQMTLQKEATYGVNYPTWFLSVYLFVNIFILYPLISFFKNKKYNRDSLFIHILILIAILLLAQFNFAIHKPVYIFYSMTNGMVIGLSFSIIGFLIYLFKDLKFIKNNANQSIFQILCLLFYFYLFSQETLNQKIVFGELVSKVFPIVLFYSALNKNTLLEKIASLPVIKDLHKLSWPIFLFHIPLWYLLKNLFHIEVNANNYIYFISFVILVSILIHFLIEKPCVKLTKKVLNHIFDFSNHNKQSEVCTYNFLDKHKNIYSALILITIATLIYVSMFYKKYYIEKNIAKSVNSDYQEDFAFVVKTYKGDLYRSFQLYLSFLKHYKGNKKIFFVIPEKDKILFENYFKEHENEVQKKSPILITDESTFLKCPLSKSDIQKLKNKKVRPWKQQQVVKLCFPFTNIARQYVTFDSDNELIKDFDESLFIDKESGMIKTLKSDHIEVKESNYKIYKKLSANSSANGKFENNLYVSPFALWNADISKEMIIYLNNKYNWGVLDTINYKPWEIQWYAQYLELFHKDKMFILNDDEISLSTHYFTDGAKSTMIICNFVIKQLLSVDYKDKYISVLQSNAGQKEYSMKEFFEKQCKKLTNFEELYKKYQDHCQKYKCKTTVLAFQNKQQLQEHFGQYGFLTEYSK